MKLIEKHSGGNADDGQVTQTYLLKNGETATYVTPKGGKRKFLESSDPNFDEKNPEPIELD